MKNSKSILLLNTNDNGGGAAVACLRLLKAVRQYTDLKIRVLVQEKNTQNLEISVVDGSWLGNKMAFFRFVLERLYFLFFEKNKSVRYQFNPAKFGIDISQHRLVKQADALHLHWTNFGFLSLAGLQQLLKTNKPVVWTLHDMWAFTGGCHHAGDCEGYKTSCGHCKFLKNPSQTDLSHQIWKQKAKIFEGQNLTIVACSEWLANRARQSSLFKNHRVLAIPNPIDVSVFKPITKKEARLALGLSPQKQFILFAAMRIDAIGKGFSYFAEALTILTQGLDNEVELLIFGSNQSGDFDALPFKVHNLGRLSDPHQIALVYSAASVFVIPSLEENLPNTIMEAMACGTPCVGFEVGGIPEMIDHQHNGYLASYKSSEDLANGLRWVLQNGDYEVLRQNAIQKVSDNYTEEVVAKRYADLY